MAIVQMNELLSTSEAAKLLEITQRLVCRYCKQGKLGQNVGGRYLITRDEIRLFKKNRRSPGRPPQRKSA